MTRLRYVLTFLVIGGFGLMAVMPLVGIHPADAARKAFTGLVSTSDADAPTIEVSSHADRPVIPASDGTVDIQALKEIDPELAKAAVYALSNSLEADEVSILFDIVMADLHPEVQKAALYAIGNHDTEEVAEFLKEVALTHESNELAKAATYALGNSDSDQAVDALIEIVSSDADTDTRKAAVYALGNTDSDKARAALIDVLRSR